MKKLLTMILVITIAMLGTACGGSAAYPFRYQSKSYDYSSEMYYDDALFLQDATVYQPELATASMSFAMASFASMGTESYDNKSVNAADLLTSLGFGDIRANEYYHKKPETDSLGCVFGRKMIGGRPMIACGIRGANYGAEWASNMTIGTDAKYHQGFFEGSEIFLDSLRSYIAEIGLTGEIRLWMVGYSRAGAVCNLSAGRIDEAIHQKQPLLGDAVTLTKEGVYAFCFEAPQGVCYDEELYPKSEIFNNIFCIVNHNDIVTKTAMQELSFTRYGVDKVLFNRLNDPNYAEDIKKVIRCFNSYENSEVLGEYTVDDFEMKRFSGGKLTVNDNYRNWTQGLYLDDLLSRFALYGLKDRENYVADIQPGLRDIFAYIFSTSSPSASLTDLGLSTPPRLIFSDTADLLLDDLLHNPTKLKTDVKLALLSALDTLEVDVNLSSVETAVEKLMSVLVSTVLHDAEFSLLLPLVSTGNISGIGQAHQPELTLAFLRSLDPQYTDDIVEYDLSGRYYRIEIDDPSADAVVLCDGKEIAKFEGGKPVDVGSDVPYARHDTLIVCLPYQGAYTVTSSSDRISVKVYDPTVIGFSDCELKAELAEGGYRITLPKP